MQNKVLSNFDHDLNVEELAENLLAQRKKGTSWDKRAKFRGAFRGRPTQPI